jgi:hypothetical protein
MLKTNTQLEEMQSLVKVQSIFAVERLGKG